MRFHFQCPVCGHRWTAIDQKEEPMCPKCLGPAILLKTERTTQLKGKRV